MMWSAQLEQSLAVGDWVANAAYFMVVSVCAPVWEEVSGWGGSGPRHWLAGHGVGALAVVHPCAGHVLRAAQAGDNSM